MIPPQNSTAISNGSPWIGAGSLGLLFTPNHIARTPGPAPGLNYTVIPLPVAPVQEITMQHRHDAVLATYTGNLQLAVDLYRLTVERNGFMRGVLETMAHGILGLPLAWQGGSPEMISALEDQDGTPGDYRRMHPENECAKIFSDGVGLGFGLGQYLLMCWRCDEVESRRVEGIDVCVTCGARRIDRPIGQRALFQIRWRDARWLWREPTSKQWYYDAQQTRVPIHPGDGEWFLFRTVPDQDIWTHGPWTLGTEAAIMARDATYDAANTAAVCAPSHVFQAKQSGGTDPKTRRDVEAQADRLRFNNKLILPGEWEHDIHAAKAEFVDVCASIVNWASDSWEVTLTGNKMGQQSGTGFSNMDVYQRVTTRRRIFYAGAWIRQIRSQGLLWWSGENFGTRNAPVGEYDCESPEEKLAKAKADEADGIAVAALTQGYGAVGYELEPAYVEERAQRRGVRIRLKAGAPGARKLELGVDAVMACVRGAAALESLGLAPFGDERDQMTLAELAAGQRALPSESLPAPVPAGGLPGVQARLEEEDGADQDEQDAAQLAAQYTAAGLDRCPYHGRTHACPRCGVQRIYALDPATHEPRVAWRQIRRPPAPSPI